MKQTPAAPDNVSETAKEALVAVGEAVPSTSVAIPAPGPAPAPAASIITGSDIGSKGGTGDCPKGQKKATAEAAVVVTKEVTDKTSSKELSKAGGTLDSFWNSP